MLKWCHVEIPWLHVVFNVFMLSLFYFQQEKDARIIVAMLHEDHARKVFCEVISCQYVVCSFHLASTGRFHTCSTCSTSYLDFLIN